MKTYREKLCRGCLAAFKPTWSGHHFCSSACSLSAKTSPAGECLVWTGALTSKGYGVVRIKGANMLAHRLSWQIHRGDPIPALVRHKCDNPRCCNPDHLEAGSHQDNVNDMIERGRMPVGAARYNCRISDEDVRYIRASYAKRERSQRALAAMFSTTRRYIRSILDGERRKHGG